jgi:hypothetical protein
MEGQIVDDDGARHVVGPILQHRGREAHEYEYVSEPNEAADGPGHRGEDSFAHGIDCMV